MGSELIIVPVIFLTLFGIVYYYLTTRNKERLALIEAGADAKLFNSTGNNWYFVIVLGMLSVGISLGAAFGIMVEKLSGASGHENQLGYVIGIFLFAGLSLLTSFFLIRKIQKQDKN